MTVVLLAIQSLRGLIASHYECYRAFEMSSKCYNTLFILVILMILSIVQHYTITMTTNLAVDVCARLAIIYPIAVADFEAGLGAVPPNRVLNEPRKQLRKPGIELPGIDPLRHALHNVGAAAGLVAGRTIRMIGLES